MEKCNKKNQLYNSVTKRCYKSCEQKNKVTHPITKKCRQQCKKDKIRRMDDFRCVKTLKMGRQKKMRATKKATPLPTPPPPKKATPLPTPLPTKIKREEEALIPAPLKRELKVNLQFFDKLIKKGVKDGTIKHIDYSSSDRISDIISIYFHKKYNKSCPMYPIKTFDVLKRNEKIIKHNYETQSMAYKKQTTYDDYLKIVKREEKIQVINWNVDKFLKNLKLCFETGEQMIIIPLRIPGHLNMLFIKVATREIIRFEPHGSHFQNNEEDTHTNVFLEDLTAKINRYFKLTPKRAFRYIPPYDICPRTNARIRYHGFQAYDLSSKLLKNGRQVKEDGFCLLWSWFFAECVITNPEMPIAEIYKEAENILYEEPINIATIIRGYFESVNEEVKEMKIKHKSITGAYSKKHIDPYGTFLLDYLVENTSKLQKKAKQPFVGGVKQKKPIFILPEANPRVAPVINLIDKAS